MSAPRTAAFAGPGELGYQPPHTYAKTNTLRFHAHFCCVDGGPGLPPGTCQKCASASDGTYLDLLTVLDRRAR